jgi:hypothetical protein
MRHFLSIREARPKVALPRRAFLTGLIGLVAAPAIVRIENLMPVKRFPAFLYQPIRPLEPGEWAACTVSLSGEERFRLEDVRPIYEYYGFRFGFGMRHFPDLAKERLPTGGVGSVIRGLAGLRPPPEPILPRFGETEAEYLVRRAIRGGLSARPD